MTDVHALRFFRITVIGASGSGKTCLVNSFVNGVCLQRYIRTDKAVVYYKKTEINDDSEYDDVRKPIFVEVEDTPGSERGNDDDDDAAGVGAGGNAADAGTGPPKVKKGSRVVLIKDKNELLKLIEEFNRTKGKLQYKTEMDGMLGREFTVRTVAKNTSIGLPSPDGSEGGVWNFPPGAVKLKVSLTLPIDAFLHMGEKEKKSFQTLKDRKKHAMDLQSPLSAYERPIGNPDIDKTLTKNRMGFLICFDLSDETCDSLKEAMTVHQMLKKSLNNDKKGTRLKPHIWLIGCKMDKTSTERWVEKNIESAQIWSDQEEIPFRTTSAKNHQKVLDVFSEMIQAISSRENLWSLEGVDDEEGRGEESAGCFNQ